jgi:hypothetical protein
MTRIYQDTSKRELSGMLAIGATVAAILMFLLALDISITSSASKINNLAIQNGTASGICNTSVRCVTITKQPKRTPTPPREGASSPKLMASLSPREEESSIGGLRSLSPNRGIGSPMILMIWEYQKDHAG